MKTGVLIECFRYLKIFIIKELQLSLANFCKGVRGGDEVGENIVSDLES